MTALDQGGARQGRVKAVFFDAGFTLLEPVQAVAEIYLQVAAELGVHLEQPAFEEHLARCWQGHSRARGRERDLRSSEQDEHDGWHRFTKSVAAPFPILRERHEEWLRILKSRFDDPHSWRPFPQVADLLDSLRKLGLVVGVISNWHRILHRILEVHGLKTHLDFVLVSAEFGWRKPHRAIFEEGLRLAGTEPEETVHVGDSLVDDVMGAATLGIRPVLIAQRSPPEELPQGTQTVSHATLVLDLL